MNKWSPNYRQYRFNVLLLVYTYDILVIIYNIILLLYHIYYYVGVQSLDIILLLYDKIYYTHGSTVNEVVLWRVSYT